MLLARSAFQDPPEQNPSRPNYKHLLLLLLITVRDLACSLALGVGFRLVSRRFAKHQGGDGGEQIWRRSQRKERLSWSDALNDGLQPLSDLVRSSQDNGLIADIARLPFGAKSRPIASQQKPTLFDQLVGDLLEM
jgi:hypothetical protein